MEKNILWFLLVLFSVQILSIQLFQKVVIRVGMLQS